MSENGRPASRRLVLRRGAALAVGVGAYAGLARQARAQKIDKSAVMYQDSPKDGQECDACTNWAPPNACNIVAGEINPKGWCGAFAPKG